MTAYESERNRQFPFFAMHLSSVVGLSTESGPPGLHSFAQTNFNPKLAHMSCCTALFKGLYLRLGNIGHGGTLETNFIPLLTAHCNVLGSALGGGNSIPFFTAHCDVLGTAVGGGALPFGLIAPFLWHLPYLVIPLLTANCDVLGSALGGGNCILRDCVLRQIGAVCLSQTVDFLQAFGTHLDCLFVKCNQMQVLQLFHR